MGIIPPHNEQAGNSALSNTQGSFGRKGSSVVPTKNHRVDQHATLNSPVLLHPTPTCLDALRDIQIELSQTVPESQQCLRFALDELLTRFTEQFDDCGFQAGPVDKCDTECS